MSIKMQNRAQTSKTGWMVGLDKEHELKKKKKKTREQVCFIISACIYQSIVSSG